jgi:hypothetical protein
MKAVFQRSVHTRIVIEASAEAVWSVLSNLKTYGQWNKLVPEATGRLAVGSSVAIQVDLPHTRKLRTNVLVTAIKQFECLGWLGHFWMPGLLDGHHTYRLSVISPTQTELVHEEIFQGLFVPFVWGSYGVKFEQRFAEANAGLKAFVERRSGV